MNVGSFRALGCDVVVGGASEAELEAVRRLFAFREAVFSRFRRDSELATVNGSRSSVVAVSPLFAHAVREALDAAAATGGLVDPTVASVLEAAGYDRDLDELAVEGPAGVAAPGGSWRSLRLSGRLLARPPAIRLDLDGVVEAMAVDDAVALLEHGGFVSAGGDVATRGGAVVALPHGGTVELRRGGIATSGVTRRRWVRGGEEQHHPIDPRAGRPSASRWSLVTVAASRCVTADVAAKAAFLLGDDGPDWLDAHGLPGRFVEGDAVVCNASWRALGVEREPA